MACPTTRSCIESILMIFCSMVFLFISFYLGFRCALDPKPPEVSVTGADVDAACSLPQQHSGNFTLRMAFMNPNQKLGVSYNNVTAALLSNSSTLVEVSVQSFSQRKKETTLVQGTTEAAIDSELCAVAHSRRVGGTAAFEVVVTAHATYRSLMRLGGRYSWELHCEGVHVGFSNDTVRIPDRCQVIWS